MTAKKSATKLRALGSKSKKAPGKTRTKAPSVKVARPAVMRGRR